MLFNRSMRFIKEPLLHFTVIGFIFFGVYSFLNRSGTPESGIRITSEKIQSLETAFSKDWNRAPTEEELKGLIEDDLHEELAFREGMALGLDQNDPVIRQRIRQKLELMVEEDAVITAPIEAEVSEYLKIHADLFRDQNGAVPKLDDIRSLVIFEWENQQRLEQLDRFYAELESKYGVQFEQAEK